MSRVSVVIPCYNYARYLADCAGSVLAQEGVEIDLLIIDDASTDDTPAVAARIAARDVRVTVRRHETNRGHIATYNEGLDWAGGDYTLVISSDDLLTPGALARAAALLDAHPAAGFVYGEAVRFALDGPRPAPVPREGWTVVDGDEWIAARCRAARNPITFPEVVMRTALHRRVGGFRADLPHTADLELWLRLAAHAPVGVLAADQAYVRVHTMNMHRTRYKRELDRLLQRRGAFQALFDVDDRPGLKRLAYRGLAADALWSIGRDVVRGRLSVEIAAGLLAFARETAGAAYLAPGLVHGAARALGSRRRRDRIARTGLAQ